MIRLSLKVSILLSVEAPVIFSSKQGKQYYFQLLSNIVLEVFINSVSQMKTIIDTSTAKEEGKFFFF